MLSGYLLRKFEYEGAPFILAMVIGPMMEEALRQSLILFTGSFAILVLRPISAAFKPPRWGCWRCRSCGDANPRPARPAADPVPAHGYANLARDPLPGLMQTTQRPSSGCRFLVPNLYPASPGHAQFMSAARQYCRSPRPGPG